MYACGGLTHGNRAREDENGVWPYQQPLWLRGLVWTMCRARVAINLHDQAFLTACKWSLLRYLYLCFVTAFNGEKFSTKLLGNKEEYYLWLCFFSSAMFKADYSPPQQLTAYLSIILLLVDNLCDTVRFQNILAVVTRRDDWCRTTVKGNNGGE
jgi:hypothetical protein